MRNIYVQLGRRIRARREESEISQTQLATRADLTRTSISNIENGRQHVPLHTLYRIASALGCHPNALLPEPAQIATAGELESALASGTDRSDVKRFLSNIQKETLTEE